MGSRYLTDLEAWLRSTGYPVVAYEGWQTRARSSGGYDHDRPWCVMWHHTASRAAPADDAYYMCHGSSDRPIANLLVARTGELWLLAAGATNTNGKGGPRGMSRGTVPVDAMNTYAVGMEIANDGTGEVYPQAQIDAAFAASLAITDGLGLLPTDVDLHYFWAPSRKSDPARADAVSGPWWPRSVTPTGTWNLDDLRAELTRRAHPTPPPPEDDMTQTFVRHPATGNLWNAWVVFPGGKWWVSTNDAIGRLRAEMGEPIGVDDTYMVATGPVVPGSPNPTDNAYGLWSG